MLEDTLSNCCGMKLAKDINRIREQCLTYIVSHPQIVICLLSRLFLSEGESVSTASAIDLMVDWVASVSEMMGCKKNIENRLLHTTDHSPTLSGNAWSLS